MGGANARPLEHGRFVPVRAIRDQRYGSNEWHLFEDPKTHDQALQISSDTLYLSDEMRQKFINRADDPGVLQIYSHHVEKEEGMILLGRDTFIVDFLVEYHPLSLQGEMEKRRKELKYITEPEIWYIIYAVSNACAALVHDGSTGCHGDIQPANIFVTNDGYVKLAPHQILTCGKNGYLKVKKDEGIALLSPGQLADLKAKKDGSSEMPEKSDVYSLGMTALAAATFANVGEYCYNWSDRRVVNTQIEDLITKVGLRYSTNLIDMLRLLLDDLPENRPDFARLSWLLSFYANRGIDHMSKKEPKEHREKIRPAKQLSPAMAEHHGIDNFHEPMEHHLQPHDVPVHPHEAQVPQAQRREKPKQAQKGGNKKDQGKKADHSHPTPKPSKNSPSGDRLPPAEHNPNYQPPAQRKAPPKTAPQHQKAASGAAGGPKAKRSVAPQASASSPFIENEPYHGDSQVPYDHNSPYDHSGYPSNHPDPISNQQPIAARTSPSAMTRPANPRTSAPYQPGPPQARIPPSYPALGSSGYPSPTNRASMPAGAPYSPHASNPGYRPGMVPPAPPSPRGGPSGYHGSPSGPYPPGPGYHPGMPPPMGNPATMGRSPGPYPPGPGQPGFNPNMQRSPGPYPPGPGQPGMNPNMNRPPGPYPPGPGQPGYNPNMPRPGGPMPAPGVNPNMQRSPGPYPPGPGQPGFNPNAPHPGAPGMNPNMARPPGPYPPGPGQPGFNPNMPRPGGPTPAPTPGMNPNMQRAPGPGQPGMNPSAPHPGAPGMSPSMARPPGPYPPGPSQSGYNPSQQRPGGPTPAPTPGMNPNMARPPGPYPPGPGQPGFNPNQPRPGGPAPAPAPGMNPNMSRGPAPTPYGAPPPGVNPNMRPGQAPGMGSPQAGAPYHPNQVAKGPTSPGHSQGGPSRAPPPGPAGYPGGSPTGKASAPTPYPGAPGGRPQQPPGYNPNPASYGAGGKMPASSPNARRF